VATIPCFLLYNSLFEHMFKQAVIKKKAGNGGHNQD